ncbi:MAG: short-subunit dehydrogenase [Porticoccus sp.]|jgi:short-subunit dehydrogenase
MKSVFITGAASGIGLATAQRFAAQGWFVGLYDINESGVIELLQTAEFSNAYGSRCDVTDHNSVRSALAHFTKMTNGKIDVIINNAGVLSGGEFSEIDHTVHDLMIDINVKGFTYLAQLGFPYLQETKNSIMVCLCSASSIRGVPLLGVYAATKFYVRGLCEALSIEWKQHGVRVTLIKPGFVATGMLDAVPNQLVDLMGVDLKPEDIVSAIWTAIHSNKQSIIVGGKIKILDFVLRFLPQSLASKLMARQFGFH